MLAALTFFLKPVVARMNSWPPFVTFHDSVSRGRSLQQQAPPAPRSMGCSTRFRLWRATWRRRPALATLKTLATSDFVDALGSLPRRFLKIGSFPFGGCFSPPARWGLLDFIRGVCAHARALSLRPFTRSAPSASSRLHAVRSPGPRQRQTPVGSPGPRP